MNTTHTRLALVVALALAAVLPVRAQLDTSKLGRIDVASIQNPRVESSDAGYVLKLEVMLRNGNPEAIKLRNAVFMVSIDSQKGTVLSHLNIGTARICELVVPGILNQNDVRGVAAVEIKIEAGPKNETTSTRLFEILNLLADSDGAKSITLQGTSEIGLQLPRGWAFEVGKRYEVDLGYEPKVSRSLALK